MMCRNYVLISAILTSCSFADAQQENWSAFRGTNGTGVADGYPVRESWHADSATADVEGVLWRKEVPGLGHSSPTIYGNKLFVASAIASDGDAPLKVGRGGAPTAADDHGEQSWVVFCFDKTTGEELWRTTAFQGKPRATRHEKATHANTSVVVDDQHVVAFFGSEGLYCFDHSGQLLWSRDLGIINISKYGVGWGYASSPAIDDDRIALVCDDPKNPFVVVLRLSDGEEIWRTARNDDCERSWGTPLIHDDDDDAQLVVNGWPWIVSYDMKSGQERWRIRGGGDNPIPTPFVVNDLIYITNAHGSESPIYAIRPDASGDITGSKDEPHPAVAWNVRRGGSYMSTPVVYGDYLYLGNTNGVIRCFHAMTGDKVYEKRLGTGASIIASLVAADGKIYAASENGTVYVVKPGPDFEVLAMNSMGEPCFASPAISAGVLYIRTTKSLFAIK